MKTTLTDEEYTACSTSKYSGKAFTLIGDKIVINESIDTEFSYKDKRMIRTCESFSNTEMDKLELVNYLITTKIDKAVEDLLYRIRNI